MPATACGCRGTALFHQDLNARKRGRADRGGRLLPRRPGARLGAARRTRTARRQGQGM